MSPETIFIIGAGASVPFKLPTGTVLRDRLCNSERIVHYATTIHPLYEHQDLEDTIKNCKNLSQMLARSGTNSIDAFLESNPEMEKLGKLLIASSLLPDEVAAIKFPAPGWDWIGWLFNNVLPSDRWLGPAWPVGFITFNYDRILEFAFRDMLHLRLGLSIHEASSAVKESPIVHMYGRFEDFTENDRYWPLDEHPDRAFSSITPLHYRYASNGIKIISAQRRDEDSANTIETANELLRNARQIIFLGFGFDRINLHRLGVEADGRWPTIRPDATVCATAHGLLGVERNVPFSIISEQLKRRNYFYLTDDQSYIGTMNENCLMFLRRRYNHKVLFDSNLLKSPLF